MDLLTTLLLYSSITKDKFLYRTIWRTYENRRRIFNRAYQIFKRKTVKDIAAKTGLAINTLTNMLDKMEASDLIFRIQCDKDKRKKYIFLTPKGKALEDKSQVATEKMNEIFYTGFNSCEIEIFESYLRRIIANLEEEENGK